MLVMIDARLGKIESQITVLMWMIAINIALVVSTMVGMLNVMLRVPR